jgi:predicted ATPase
MKQFGACRLDTLNQCLWRDGVAVNIPPKPYSVLQYLVEHPGRLVTQDELLKALWPETYVQAQVLRTYVLDLRRVLGDDAGNPRFIATIPKRGYRFLAPVAEASPAPLAGSSSAGDAVRPIVGRDEELSKLHALMERACNGERQMAFVSGEAGIGKSALIEAFCGELGDGVRITRGGSIERLGVKEPHEAIERMAQEMPLLLVMEDLQWADGATLGLLSTLARRGTPARILLIATCRPSTYRPASVAAPARSDEAKSAPLSLRALKQDLVLRHLCTVITLAPISRAAVAEYLAREFIVRKRAVSGAGAGGMSGDGEGEPAASGLAAFLHQHSGGNPLFLSAILDDLITKRTLIPADEGWGLRVPLAQLEIEVPESLREGIDLEIEALTDPDQRLLEAASIFGSVFPVWAAAAVLRVDAAEAEEQFEALVRRAAFVRGAGHDELPDGARSTSYVFAHGFYREVLYGRQPEARRSRGHQRIAEALGRLFAGSETGVAAEVAAHYEAAGNWSRAAEMLAKMAVSAASNRDGHREEAAKLIDRALELAGNLGLKERFKLESKLKTLARKLSHAPLMVKPHANRSRVRRGTVAVRQSARK